MKFICDDNLGKLAKYLRILGFDTSFTERIENGELLRLAASEERFLLTRDHHLASKSHPFGILILDMDGPLEQLRDTVLRVKLKIDPLLLFQRCSRCNSVCHKISKSEARNNLFPFILKTQEIISQCPSCKRYYWKGTHYQRLLREFKETIPNSTIVGSWPEESL